MKIIRYIRKEDLERFLEHDRDLDWLIRNSLRKEDKACVGGSIANIPIEIIIPNKCVD
jgi:hypothetical protein